MKKTLLILFVALFTGLVTKAQSTRPGPGGDQPTRIVKLYPNPATTYITLEVQKSDDKFSIQVYNFLGKKMYEAQNVSDKVTVDLAEFNRGVYIYHLRDQAGKIVESGKFQVSR